ncbi:MAG: efflux RND transporter periplasmic adaptor subunit [Bacteroidetes bacterium]|nr:efflux RND transporter periplasmic adaptor subunit [Bacteroidota bacterium]
MKKRKKVLWIFLILTLLLIIIVMVGKRKGWFGRGAGIRVSVEEVGKRNIIETITANGKIQPETEVKISSDVSGEIVELYITEGREVKEGDLLLKIDPDIYLSNIERMEASLNSAKANLANSKARLVQMQAQFSQTSLAFDRNKKLWEQKTISEAEFESSKSAFEMGEAEVEAAGETANAAEFTVMSAEAALKEARENLAKTIIYAPVSGTVSMLNVEKGERVVGTIQMAGTEMLRIANLNEMEVKVDVNENDIINVSLNDTAVIEVDAYLGRNFRGVVTEIANSANSTGLTADQVTSFDVKIRILRNSYIDLLEESDTAFYPFRPGMSATVDIQTRREKDVLSVPIQTVTTRSPEDTVSRRTRKRFDKTGEEDSAESAESRPDDGDEEMLEVVFVCDDGKVIIREVETGIRDNNFIQIIKGLALNEKVVTAPYSAISKRLKNKDKVEVVDKEELFSEEE